MGKGRRLVGEVLVGGNEGGGAKEGTRRREAGSLEPAKGISPRLLNLWPATSGLRNRLQAGLALHLYSLLSAMQRRGICCGCLPGPQAGLPTSGGPWRE